jgi:hypothetical protein
MAERQPVKEQFCNPERLFEVGKPGEDKSLNSQLPILQHSFGHSRRAPDKCSTRPAATGEEQ